MTRQFEIIVYKGDKVERISYQMPNISEEDLKKLPINQSNFNFWWTPETGFTFDEFKPDPKNNKTMIRAWQVYGLEDYERDAIGLRKWCEQQKPDKVFEWGGLSTGKNVLAELVKKEFKDMTDDEKKTQWLLQRPEL